MRGDGLGEPHPARPFMGPVAEGERFETGRSQLNRTGGDGQTVTETLHREFSGDVGKNWL
jgi:hypothetical protein